MVEISRSKDGVPQWSGDAASYQEYEEQALQWEQSVEHKKRYLCGPKLIQEMSGTARKLVTGKRPDWLSFNGGVAHLMKHLRSSLGRPQIPELSEYLNRYFKQSRRRKFETMNQYIVRKTEVYQRAKQALARVLPQQQSSNRGNYQWPSSSWRASSWRGSWRSATTSQDDGNGGNQSQQDQGEPWSDPWSQADRGAQDEDDESEEFQDAAEGWDTYSYRTYSQPDRWSGYEDENWTHETPELLPDFLQGWYLLMDANLTSSERNLVQTAVQGNFGSERIAQELRTQWPEEDLKDHDQGLKQSSYWQDEVEEDNTYGEELTMKGLEEAGMNEEGIALVADAESQIEEAMAVIEKGKRTLREARAKQHQVKMNRQYYKTEVEKYKSRSGPLKCFRCGGNHKIANCPDRMAPRNNENKVESAPFVCYAKDEEALATSENMLTTEEAVLQGYGIIDGGATKTLGSVHALEAVAAENYRKYQDDHIIDFDPRIKPTFGFGNSSRNTCVSTAKLKISAGDQSGVLQVHALDEGQGPVLLSISTLRALGAIIDFEEDLVVFRRLDDRRMIQATRSQSGHQLLPLTENLYSKSVQCHSAVPSLRSFC